MSDHPSPQDPQQFMAGGLSGPAAKTILAHLFRRCDLCRSAMQAAMSPPASSEALSAELEQAYDKVIDRAFRTARGCAEFMNQVESRAEAASVRPPIQNLAALSPACRGDIPTVELYLEEAQALRYHDPKGMVAAAQLARVAAHYLDHEVYDPKVIADTRARAWAELANAYRINDELTRAEEVMKRASHYLERGSGDPRLRARFLELSASLFCDQRWFADAFDVLREVRLIYDELGDQHQVGRTLLTMSHYAACEGKPDRALRFLMQGWELIDGQREPDLASLALQNLIHHLADCGWFRKAQNLLWQARMAGVLPEGGMAALKLTWTSGRIHVGLNQLAQAEKAFGEARDGFEKSGLAYKSGLVALELAAVWMRQGRQDEVLELAASLVDRFRELGIKREATAAVAALRQACEQQIATVEMVEEVAAYLRELDRRPDVALPPPRWV